MDRLTLPGPPRRIRPPMSTAVAPRKFEASGDLEAHAPTSVVRDLLALTKPRITLMVLLTAAGGMWLEGVAVSWGKLVATLVGMSLIVGAANSFNCWLERDLDRLMARTKNRPLPAGRLAPRTAVMFGAALAALALPVLYFGVNPLTGVLGAAAFGSYVAIYTPLKTLSPAALLVGAVPGALPPLMGSAAASGRITAEGLLLFGLLFLWQLPHSIAIASFRKAEYEAAGMRVLPAVRGDRVARLHAAFWALLL
ncbi:MAG: heme o synthase [Polyangiales bacterium]